MFLRKKAGPVDADTPDIGPPLPTPRGGAPVTLGRPHRPSIMQALMPACVALWCLAGPATAPALAQDANDPAASDPDNPILNRNARRGFGLDTGRNGLSTLREPGNAAPAFGTSPITGDSPGGESSGGDPAVGLSGGGASVSRLPRFRTGGGQSISSISGTTARTTPSLLRQRAAPPRRFRQPSRLITQERLQGFVQDTRLTPVIQEPVSGVPLPTPGPIPLIARSFPLFGLVNPGGLSPTAAFTRLPDEAADPAYAPLGIKIGTFTVLPAFTQWVGYDTNPDQTVPRSERGSPALRSDGEVAFRSDWSSSSFAGELRGSYIEFPDNETASRPSGSGGTRLRIDINRDTRFEVETRFVVDTQRYGSPDLGGARMAASRPLFATFGATAGIVESFNRLELSVRGAIDRQIFEDARLSDGSTLIQSDRNANQYSLRLRAAYEISPTISPFVEGIVDTRVYDMPIDQYGVRRDSDGIGFTAGARIQLANRLAGEISAGLQHRDYVDRTLRPITAPLVNTALIWAASPLTTVRLTQQTGVTETSVTGSSGVFTDIASLEVQHDLLRNLSITVGGGYLSNTYQGASIREHGYSALVRADYRLNRWLTLRGSYIYQTIASTSANSSYSDNILLMGVRLNP